MASSAELYWTVWLKFEMGNIIGVNFWPRVLWGLEVILLNTLF